MKKQTAKEYSYLAAIPDGVGVTDFHTHLLPGMDDGSKSLDESLKMLGLLADAGVTRVIATPHFYARSEKPSDFFARRADRLNQLREALPEGSPEILAGAEVYFFDGLVMIDELERFRVEGSELILIEMPFSRWSDRMVQDIKTIHSRRGFCVVLAHAERYYEFGNLAAIRELSDCGVLIQANASFFRGFFGQKKALRAFSSGLIDLLGSDCHNLDTRAPDLGTALEALYGRLGAEDFADFLTGTEDTIRGSAIS